jgi:hypothetical protein
MNNDNNCIKLNIPDANKLYEIKHHREIEEAKKIYNNQKRLIEQAFSKFLHELCEIKHTEEIEVTQGKYNQKRSIDLTPSKFMREGSEITVEMDDQLHNDLLHQLTEKGYNVRWEKVISLTHGKYNLSENGQWVIKISVRGKNDDSDYIRSLDDLMWIY